MSNTKVSNALLNDSVVDSSKLASASITNNKILDGSITSSKLANDVIKNIQTTGNLIKAKYNSSNQTVELTSPLEITFGYEYVNDMTNSTTENTEGAKNFADIFPPEGKNIQNLVGFIVSHRDVLFDGGVNVDDRFYCQWQFHNGQNIIYPNPSNVFSYGSIFQWGSSISAGGKDCAVSNISNSSPNGTELFNLGSAPFMGMGQTNVLKMVVSGPDPYYATWGFPAANIAPAFAGETWTFSAYVKADRNTQVQLFLFEADGLGITTGTTAQTFNATTSWQRIHVTRPFSNSLTRNIQIRVDGPDSGFSADGTTRPTIYWGGVQIEKSSSPTVYKSSFNTYSVYEVPPNADRIRVWSGNTEQRKDEYGNNGSFNYLAIWI